MRNTHPSGALQALYSVFVQPQLSRTLQREGPRFQRKPVRCPTVHQCRQLSVTTARSAKSRPPESRTQKWDEEIQSRWIALVDPATNSLLEPRSRYDILNSFDRATHRLIQVSPDEPNNQDFIPTCKLISKKDLYSQGKKRKEQAKARAKSGELGMKTLELNWAIDSNDLAHRLNKVADFLAEGRRVEVVLASKKRGRRATEEECRDVLKLITETLERVPGAKESKALEGKLGGLATMVLEGKARNN